MFSIADNIQNVRKRIKKAQAQVRLNESKENEPAVQLLAVSKKRSAIEIQQAISAEVRQFGENYLNEALSKQEDLKVLIGKEDYDRLTWHFIGPIQSNKTRPIAEHFDWVQSVDRLKIAQRLNEQRPDGETPLNICIQININREESKSGVALNDVQALAKAIDSLPNLTLRGLMCIPKGDQSKNELLASFQKMRSTFLSLKKEHTTVDTLSMGMSADIESAISGGSTMVRVGTDLFGIRS